MPQKSPDDDEIGAVGVGIAFSDQTDENATALELDNMAQGGIFRNMPDAHSVSFEQGESSLPRKDGAFNDSNSDVSYLQAGVKPIQREAAYKLADPNRRGYVDRSQLKRVLQNLAIDPEVSPQITNV